MRALNHLRPDRIPRFDEFWDEFRQKCAEELHWTPEVTPNDFFGNDIGIVVADATPFPSRVETLRMDGDAMIMRDGWGRVVRTRPKAYFYEDLDFLIREPRDLDRVKFDSPLDDARYVRFDAAAFRADRRC